MPAPADLLPPLETLRERLALNLDENRVIRTLIRLAERRAEDRSFRRHVGERLKGNDPDRPRAAATA